MFVSPDAEVDRSTIPVEMTWSTTDCDVGAAHARRTALGLVDDDSGRRHADITISSVGDGAVHVRIVLAVDDLVVERELDASSCTLGADAAMVVVGANLRALDRAALDVTAVDVMAVDDEDDGATIATPAADAPEIEPKPVPHTPSVARTSVTPPHATRTRTRSGHGWLGVLGGASFGPLPRASGAVGLVFAWQWPLARIQLEATHIVTRSVAATTDATARLSGWSLALRAGVAPRWRHLRIPALLGLEVVDVVGTPRGTLVDRRSGQRAAIALALDSGFWWSPRPRLALGVHGGLTVAVLRAAFEFGREDGSPLAVPDAHRLGARIGAAAAVRLR